MRRFLAIDAGGTKTDYVLADEARELARVRGGSIKRMRVDEATATANLEAALTSLSQASGLSLDSVACTCVGTAGVTVPLVIDWLRKALSERVTGELILVSDVEIALEAAFPDGGGVLALAGTGSNVAGRAQDGELITAGGWGPVLADQGAGHRVGVGALREIFAAVDEGRDTSMLQAVLDFWKLDSLNALVSAANTAPAPDFSKLTVPVLACAQAGDAAALDVLRREGTELAHLVKIVLRRLHADTTAGPFGLAFAGSILENVLPLREALIAAVEEEFPGIRVVEDAVDPVAGALRYARMGKA